MSVHYKFKSSLEYDTVTFDGLHISVSDLKKAIMQQKKIGKSADFDLQITNAQTKEVYDDNEVLIPKNTSVIVSRIPVTTTGKKTWERNDVPLQLPDRDLDSGHHYDKLAKTADLVNANATEEEKIKAMMTQSSEEYDPSKYIKSRSMTGPLPSSYTCYRCGKSGHWIKNCPTNNMDIKKSTGIPRSFMVPVDGPEHKGALLTSTGEYAVPVIDMKAYREVKKDKPPFLVEPEAEKPPEPSIPDDLICTYCKDLLHDAVLISCCGSSFCDECARQALLDSENLQCPICNEQNVSPDTLIPNRFLRTAVNKFKNETGYTRMRREFPPPTEPMPPPPVQKPREAFPQEVKPDTPPQQLPLPTPSKALLPTPPIPPYDMSKNEGQFADAPDPHHHLKDNVDPHSTNLPMSHDSENDDNRAGTPLADEPSLDMMQEHEMKATMAGSSQNVDSAYNENGALGGREDATASSGGNTIMTITSHRYIHSVPGWISDPHHYVRVPPVGHEAVRHPRLRGIGYRRGLPLETKYPRYPPPLRARYVPSHRRYEHPPSVPNLRRVHSGPTAAVSSTAYQSPTYHSPTYQQQDSPYRRPSPTYPTRQSPPYQSQSPTYQRQSPPPGTEVIRLPSAQPPPPGVGPPLPPPSAASSSTAPPPSTSAAVSATPSSHHHGSSHNLDYPSYHKQYGFDEFHSRDSRKFKERSRTDPMDDFARKLMEYKPKSKRHSNSPRGSTRSPSPSGSSSYSSSKSWSRSPSRSPTRSWSRSSRSPTYYSSRSRSRSYSRSRSRSRSRSYSRSTRSRTPSYHSRSPRPRTKVKGSPHSTRSRSRSPKRFRHTSHSHSPVPPPPRPPCQDYPPPYPNPSVYSSNYSPSIPHRHPPHPRESYNPDRPPRYYKEHYHPPPDDYQGPSYGNMNMDPPHDPSRYHWTSRRYQKEHQYRHPPERFKKDDIRYGMRDMPRYHQSSYPSRSTPDKLDLPPADIDDRQPMHDKDHRMKPERMKSQSQQPLPPLYKSSESSRRMTSTIRRSHRIEDTDERSPSAGGNDESRRISSSMMSRESLKKHELESVIVKDRKAHKTKKHIDEDMMKKKKHKKNDSVSITSSSEEMSAAKKKPLCKLSPKETKDVLEKEKTPEKIPVTVHRSSDMFERESMVPPDMMFGMKEPRINRNIVIVPIRELPVDDLRQSKEPLSVTEKSDRSAADTYAHNKESDILEKTKDKDELTEVLTESKEVQEPKERDVPPEDSVAIENATSAMDTSTETKDADDNDAQSLHSNDEQEDKEDIASEEDVKEEEDEGEDDGEEEEEEEEEDDEEANGGEDEEEQDDVLKVEPPELSKWEREDYDDMDDTKPTRRVKKAMPKEVNSLPSDIIEKAEKAILQKPLKAAIVTPTSARDKQKNDKEHVKVAISKEGKPEHASSKEKGDSSMLQITITSSKEKRSVKERSSESDDRDRSLALKKRKAERMKASRKVGGTSHDENKKAEELRALKHAEKMLPIKRSSSDSRKKPSDDRHSSGERSPSKRKRELSPLDQNIRVSSEERWQDQAYKSRSGSYTRHEDKERYTHYEPPYSHRYPMDERHKYSIPHSDRQDLREQYDNTRRSYSQYPKQQEWQMYAPPPPPPPLYSKSESKYSASRYRSERPWGSEHGYYPPRSSTKPETSLHHSRSDYKQSSRYSESSRSAFERKHHSVERYIEGEHHQGSSLSRKREIDKEVAARNKKMKLLTKSKPEKVALKKQRSPSPSSSEEEKEFHGKKVYKTSLKQVEPGLEPEYTASTDSDREERTKESKNASHAPKKEEEEEDMAIAKIKKQKSKRVPTPTRKVTEEGPPPISESPGPPQSGSGSSGASTGSHSDSEDSSNAMSASQPRKKKQKMQGVEGEANKHHHKKSKHKKHKNKHKHKHKKKKSHKSKKKEDKEERDMASVVGKA